MPNPSEGHTDVVQTVPFAGVASPRASVTVRHVLVGRSGTQATCEQSIYEEGRVGILGLRLVAAACVFSGLSKSGIDIQQQGGLPAAGLELSQSAARVLPQCDSYRGVANDVGGRVRR